MWTGNAKERRIGGLNFQPDLVWIKRRDGQARHNSFDSLRGVGTGLSSNLANAEYNNQETLTSFNQDGFSLGADSGGYAVNGNSHNNVAWCWKAGNETVEDASGTIKVTRSTNVDAGFSIISWNGTGVAGTIPHGLGKNVEFLWYKNRAVSYTHLRAHET